MLECCAHCEDYAPAWDLPEYADWYVALTDTGDSLGVICPGCFAGHDLVFVGLEAARPPAVRTTRRRSARRVRRLRDPHERLAA
jgi:hypothetical protein